MISSAKRLCNKYLSFSNDGGVFHLRLYPQGELLTAVAQWCQVLFGSLDIDYLSCSKLPLRVQKKCVWCFFFFFSMAFRVFLSYSVRDRTTQAQNHTFRYEGKLSSLLGRYLDLES